MRNIYFDYHPHGYMKTSEKLSSLALYHIICLPKSHVPVHSMQN